MITKDYDRPNTVSGLVAKHAELTALREKYRAEIKKLTVDIDHLDAAIRLFDPNADTSLRIPTKPATHSNRKPATYSNMKPARIPI